MTVDLPSSPYKGLNAFEDSELDALLFFGREREREIVAANLAASRLTVLYGPSGVGKSSLLHAAVARSLRRLAEEPLVVVFSRWRDDPGAALANAVADAAGVTSNGSPLGVIEHAQSNRDVYLILDQAEEYFLYHAEDEGPESLARTLPAVIGGRYRVNVLISLREDSLAKLDRFTGRIPGLFGNTLRLDRLDRDAARAATIRPIERFAELTHQSVTVDPQLVERVLDDVGAGRIEPALGGRGSVESSANGALIEAPYLQLVLQRLWDEERTSGSDVLRLETLERLGGSRRIVEEHLEGAMAQLGAPDKDTAARFFNHLVTPSGTKIGHRVSDLADFGGVAVAEVEPVLEALAERRILRSVEEASGVRYEIFHDVLAQPVLAWRARHRAERELERKLADAHRRRRRFTLLFALVLVALGLMTAVSVYALSQRDEAQTRARVADERTREAQSLKLQALARGKLAVDPELGLLLARAAARAAPAPSALETLRDVLEQSRLRAVVRLHAPVVRAMVRERNVIAVTGDGSVVRSDLRSRGVRTRAATGHRARDASFSDDGSALLTGPDGRLRLVTPRGSVKEVPGIFYAEGATISADGKRALVFNARTVRLFEIASGTELQRFPRTETLAAALSRDGTLAATGHVGQTVRVWRTATAQRIHKPLTNVGDIVAVAISPDRERVASASTKGLAQVWRVADERVVALFGGLGKGLTDVAFSPNGRLLVTAGDDGTVRIAVIDKNTRRADLRGHADSVASAAFSADGRSVVSAGSDGTVRVWDARPVAALAARGSLDRLVGLATRRLAATGRELTAAERQRYLG